MSEYLQRTPWSPRTVVIVGAGFSGITLAINLLRQLHAQPLRIVLIERSPSAGGVAYARRSYPYLLNVPAARMSANSLDAAEFLRFARRSRPSVSAEDYLPRELYGEYLQAALASAEVSAAPHVELKRLRGSVAALEQSHRNRVLEVHLADGRKVSAHAAVLALGNPPPSPVNGSEALRGSPRYIEDPWQSAAAIRAGETVLMIGTGLTMVDTVLAGMQAASGQAVFRAISRHGLIPAAQRPFRQLGEEDGTSLIKAASVSLLHLFRASRSLAENLECSNGDWREAVALVRDLAPTLWQRLPASERRRFLRHARRYWDIHRHRLPESISAALDELRRSDKLRIHAGRILEMQPADETIQVKWRARGSSETTTLSVDRVINCTGPDYDVQHTRERLLRSLLAQGTALRDPLGLGLVTDEMGALVDIAGRAASNIYYLGPMLRARYWETTAVTELREHAARLARHLTSDDAWRAVADSRHVSGVQRPSAPAHAGATLR